MTYKRNYLTDVILRVDFTPTKLDFDIEQDIPVNDICLKYLPIFEERTRIKLDIDERDSRQMSSIITKERHYFSASRGTELILTQTSLTITTKEYTVFETFKLPFIEVLSAFLNIDPSIQISRLGLRYIDQIDLSDDKTKKDNWITYWKKYISSDLLQSLTFAKDDAALTRTMGNIEMNFGDCFLKFQYGIFNEDYPAVVKKQKFIIDTDVYASGLIGFEDIEQKLRIFNDKSYYWFEKSIKQPLRQKMGISENE